MAKRIEFRYAPQHGSWPSVAPAELSTLSLQRLERHRISDLDTLQREIAA